MIQVMQQEGLSTAMSRVSPDEIERFLADFCSIVSGRKSLRQHREEAPPDQREADKRSMMCRGAPTRQDDFSEMFDNEVIP